MIYTIISDTLGRKPLGTYSVFSSEDCKKCPDTAIKVIKKNKNCRILRQFLPNLPKDISDYINLAKNDNTKAERQLAYTSLFSSLSTFFEIEDAKIERDSFGKPFVKYSGEKQIFISISHSEGAVAISLSDEGNIGIDLQAEADEKRAERLDGRFLKGFDVESEPIPISYYYCTIENGSACFTEISLTDAKENGFIERWSALESLLKLDGRGFSNLSDVKENSNDTKTSIKLFELDGKKYALSNSIKV